MPLQSSFLCSTKTNNNIHQDNCSCGYCLIIHPVSSQYACKIALSAQRTWPLLPALVLVLVLLQNLPMNFILLTSEVPYRNTLPWIGRVGLHKAFITICYKMHGWKDVLKVEHNDPHKFASKLRGFPFTVRTNTVGHLWESKI